MAGETEDCLSYQADRLPTGSISFGRYEVESLSWERRSSFSHNRYLEEVEKYSTPGSVTQKRAILEAHFKKKPLVPQTSLEHQDEVEYEATKDHVEQETSGSKELVDNDNVHPEFALYHDTPAGSDKTEIMEGEEEDSPFEHISYNDEKVLHPSSDLSGLDETLEPQAESLIQPSNKDSLRVVVELEPDNKAVIVEELLEKREDIIVEEVRENREDIVVAGHENRGISSRSSTVESKNVNSLKKTQKASLKVNEAIEQKPAKIKRTQLPVQQNLRNSSTKRSSVSMRSKSVKEEERDNTLTTKSVKQYPSRTSMATSFDSKNLKLEPSQILISKARKEKRSVKDVQVKKGVVKAHSVSGKSEMGIHQPANRPKEVADSAKEEVKQSGSLFSFKCEERAERRKEYYTKLEEKLHAKEAEMNVIQARTQEEKEAQIKQFRRSLNFKATPMPSFYHESVPRVSEGKKLATPTKPQKLQSKSTSLGSRSNREKSPAVSKPSNHASPTHEPNRAIQSPQKTESGKKDTRSRPTVQQRRESSANKADSVMRRSVSKVVKNGMVAGSVVVHVAS